MSTNMEEFSDELHEKVCSEALNAVIQTLTPLDPTDQERVVRTACVFLEIAQRTGRI